jgi:MFS family permease
MRNSGQAALPRGLAAALLQREAARNNRAFAVLLVGATLWCIGIVAAPALGLAWTYDFFARICHQDPARCWQIFGRPFPVCIRCTSIYFAFTLSLWVGLKPSVRWLRISIALMLCEFVLARFLVDAALLRSFSGALVGLSAAPFVRKGVEEIRDAM